MPQPANRCPHCTAPNLDGETRCYRCHTRLDAPAPVHQSVTVSNDNTWPRTAAIIATIVIALAAVAAFIIPVAVTENTATQTTSDIPPTIQIGGRNVDRLAVQTGQTLLREMVTYATLKQASTPNLTWDTVATDIVNSGDIPAGYTFTTINERTFELISPQQDRACLRFPTGNVTDGIGNVTAVTATTRCT